MRWDELFQDLEGQWAAAEAADLAAQVTDRTRREVADVWLLDRLRAASAQRLALHVQGAGQVDGRLLEVGADWLLIEERRDGQTVVRLPAILGVLGLGRRPAAPSAAGRGAALGSRLRLGYALRRLARDRLPVAVVLVDGGSVTGTIDRVGADFLDLAEHPVGEARRHLDVHGVRAVPFAALAAVRGR